MRWANKHEHDDSDSEDEAEVVRIVDTDIFFYGDINTANIMELNTKLLKLEKKLLRMKVDIKNYNPRITIHIKSDGGDIFAGLSGMDHISACRVPVDTIADGVCASAATFLLMGGKVRYMRPSAYVLIHQMSSEFWGKYEEMKDELKSCEKFMKIIRGIYEQKTKINSKKLNNMMKRDIYLTSTECLKFGVVDEIYPCTSCTDT